MGKKAGEKIERKSTSIKVDPKLWKEAKIEAIRRGIELSELVDIALRKEIGGMRRKDE
jgi:hypothetical protein